MSDSPEGWEALGASWRTDVASSSLSEVDADAVRARSEAFARQVRFRNGREIVAGLLAIAGGTWVAMQSASVLTRLGGVAIALGAVVVMLVIVSRARNLAPPVDAPTWEVLAHERRELDRQARLLERAWLWYLAPFLPGIAAIYSGVLVRLLAHDGAARTRGIAVTVVLLVVTASVFGTIGWLNTRAARGLRARMAALDERPEP